jgi:hypothetical protein
MEPILQLRKVEARVIKSWETFIPIRLLFQKFTLKPETRSKPLIRTAFKDQRLSTEASPMQNVSSAYWRWEIESPPLQKLKPLNMSSSPALLIAPPKPSATNKKRKGANGSPCFKPL